MALFNRNSAESYPIKVDPENWLSSREVNADLPILLDRQYLKRLDLPQEGLLVVLTLETDFYKRPFVSFRTEESGELKLAAAAFNRGITPDGSEVLLLSQPPIIGSKRKPSGMLELVFGTVNVGINRFLGTI